MVDLYELYKKGFKLKKLIIFVSISFILLILAIIFFKGLKMEKIFVPKQLVEKELPQFSAQTLFDNKKFFSSHFFKNEKYYLINIWASWCGPCRQEHPIIQNLANKNNLKILGINFKDNKKNAISFLDKLGNPYSEIITDKDGSLSINLGAYGVPETFLINKDQIIKLKFVGPIKPDDYKKIIKVINK